MKASIEFSKNIEAAQELIREAKRLEEVKKDWLFEKFRLVADGSSASEDFVWIGDKKKPYIG